MSNIDKAVTKLLKEEEFDDPRDSESAEEALELASELIREAVESLEVAVKLEPALRGQAEAYIIPHLKSWMNDTSQPGSIPSLYEIIEEIKQEEE